MGPLPKHTRDFVHTSSHETDDDGDTLGKFR